MVDPAREGVGMLKKVHEKLEALIDIPEEKRTMFFKVGKGDYAEHDQFLGVKVPTVRKLAKEFYTASFKELQGVLKSKVNEERMLALFVLVHQFEKGDDKKKKEIFDFYLKNARYVSNWNLVDLSAHLIVGSYLLNKNKEVLLDLASSSDLWERRIAIVSTWFFIRNKKLSWTFKLAKALLDDQHDLIHKASGWMLREAGKIDEDALKTFLEKHIQKMPRTTLRYAIERFSKEGKQYFMKL